MTTPEELLKASQELRKVFEHLSDDEPVQEFFWNMGDFRALLKLPEENEKLKKRIDELERVCRHVKTQMWYSREKAESALNAVLALPPALEEPEKCGLCRGSKITTWGAGFIDCYACSTTGKKAEPPKCKWCGGYPQELVGCNPDGSLIWKDCIPCNGTGKKGGSDV